MTRSRLNDLAERREKARQYVREHQSKIVLHALYTYWGLPTASLRALASQESDDAASD